jgi:hypothetical protein
MKRPTSAMFERQLADGGILVERSDHPPARITPHRSVNQISRLAVGVTGRLLADSQSGKRPVVLTITRPWSVATIPGAGLRRGRR